MTPDKSAPSVRRHVAWTLAGNLVLGAGQWAVLTLIARFGDRRMLGEYALAAAVALPVSMAAHANLRAALATDAAGRRPFGDYLAVRAVLTALGLIALSGVVMAGAYPRDLAATILLLGAGFAVEQFSDLYYGALQRREKMDQVGRSMMLRGALSTLAFGAVLWITRGLVPSVAALAGARLAVLALYDRPAGSANENTSRSSWRSQASIAGAVAWLGAVLMMSSLTVNVPRYAVERFLGVAELGAFAAAASLATAGGTAVNAMGQAATSRMSRYWAGGKLRAFARAAAGLAAASTAVGLAGLAVALLAGGPVLRLLYRPEYAAYAPLLVAVMAAATCGYFAQAVGYAITSTRSFAVQAPLTAAAALAASVSSWLLVPRRGLNGAAAAIALAACVQAAGGLLILLGSARRARRERP